MTDSGGAVALSSLETGLGIPAVCDDSAESAALPATASVGGTPTAECAAAVDMRAVENRRNEILSSVKQEWNSQLNAKFDRKCASETRTPMSMSERGCAASHLLLWHMASRLAAEAPPALRPASARSLPHLIIFEDDVTLSERFTTGLDALWEDVPSDVDLLFLGYWSPERTDEMRLVQGAPPAKGSPRLFRPRYLWGLHAYVVTAAGARKLLAHLPVYAPVDCFVATLVHEGHVNAYAAIDKLAHQRPQLASDIEHSGRENSGIDWGKKARIMSDQGESLRGRVVCPG